MPPGRGARPEDRDGSAYDGTGDPGPLARVPGGAFLMGSEAPDVNPGDGEGPVRRVSVRARDVGRHPVTNAEFARFVEATGHVTGAERHGWSWVFSGFLPTKVQLAADRPVEAPWWCRVDAAAWHRPEGGGSDTSGRADHPVVHVDHADALAFCAWSGTRLATEAEWEQAARGGLEQAAYAWGEALVPDGEHRCNIWQGVFPTRDDAEDGWSGTSPVGTYAPNGFGLHDVAGNVWEWTADWWGVGHSPEPVVDPRGPGTGTARVMRGGSYLCHRSWCNRYRVAARSSSTPDSSAGNLGFRVVRDLPA